MIYKMQQVMTRSVNWSGMVRHYERYKTYILIYLSVKTTRHYERYKTYILIYLSVKTTIMNVT